MALRQGANPPQFLLGDHLGSTTRTVSAAGATNGMQVYRPWGETHHTSGSLLTQYQYTGQWKSASGLYWYNSRWYDSALGRFVQPDTLIPEASQGTQAWDRFAYVNNNPLRYNDPSGHMQACAAGDEGGGCGRGASGLDLAEYYRKNARDKGGHIYWSGIKKWQQSTLQKSGWSAGSLEDHISGGATRADWLHDPATYIVGLFGLGGLVRSAGTVTTVWAAETVGPAASPYLNTIYRSSTGTAASLTPRLGPDTVPGGGLSFVNSVDLLNPGKYVAVDPTKLVNLTAVLDNNPPGHVTVAPETPALLMEWAASRGTDIVHPFTQTILNAIIQSGRK